MDSLPSGRNGIGVSNSVAKLKLQIIISPLISKTVTLLFFVDCCLRCQICDKILREDNYYVEDNKAYCRLDWIKHFAPKCYDCHRPVGEVLKQTEVCTLGGRVYHPVCFVCFDCNKILDARTFYPVEVNGIMEPFCQEHYHNRTCVDCLKSRSERVRQHEKILKSGQERMKSSMSRRSISPFSVMFGGNSLTRRPKSSQI